MTNQEGRTALITGASSGIGAAFARALAAQGFDLILVGRREKRLAVLAAELRRSVRADFLVADLSTSDGVERLERSIRQTADLELLVNNAGFGTMGPFADIDLATQLDMLHVHLVATMRLCHAALPGLIARNRGAIINVASIGAFMPGAGNVTYNATKAFLVSFSESLQKELLGTSIHVQALCPGFTVTDFHDRAAYVDLDRAQIPRWLWSSARAVVEASLKALRRHQVICIPGFKNRVLIALLRHPLTSNLVQAKVDAVLSKAAVLREVRLRA